MYNIKEMRRNMTNQMFQRIVIVRGNMIVHEYAV